MMNYMSDSRKLSLVMKISPAISRKKICDCSYKTLLDHSHLSKKRSSSSNISNDATMKRSVIYSKSL